MHEHLRSYVGQARVSLHSAVCQLRLAQTAFGPSEKLLGSGLWVAAIDVDELVEALKPLHDKVVHTHKLVVSHT